MRALPGRCKSRFFISEGEGVAWRRGEGLLGAKFVFLNEWNNIPLILLPTTNETRYGRMNRIWFTPSRNLEFLLMFLVSGGLSSFGNGRSVYCYS